MAEISLRRSPCAGAVLVASVLVACGGSGGAQPQGCGGDGTTDPCAPDGRCLAGACVSNAAPTASFTVPGDLKSLALAELDGAASTDPDSTYGDDVASWDWTFTATGAPCDPPVVAGHAKAAQVRFACAGRFRAQLVVKDQLGKASEPVVQELDVAEGSSLVQLGADQVRDHRCAGSPATCTTDGGDPTVTATVSVPAVGALHHAWTARAPKGGELGTVRLVTFPAGAPEGSAKVHVETDGYLIVDDWPIDVSVSDDAGPLGTASMRISIGNRPPRVKTTVASVSVDHTYSSGGYRATAAGAVFEDPDGDALTPVATGSTVCPSFTVTADGTAQIACSQSLDANNLGLATFVGPHPVLQQVKDPWNESSGAAASTTVTIKNRAVSAASSTVHVTHTCQQSCCRYSTDGDGTCLQLGRYCPGFTAAPHPSITDPDGDPVLLTWTSGALGDATSLCALGSCAGSYPVPASSSLCGGVPSGSTSGTFTVSDGLTSSTAATLTLTWGS